MKRTKRKGFNFFRSYFDVYNELDDSDKLLFIDALLNKQFMGVDPTELKGMAKFAYISQSNSIESQVKGFEDKTGIKLNPNQGVETPPTLAPCLGGKTPPTLQVEVEGEVQVEEKEEDTRALDFLKNKFPQRWEQEFLIKYKSKIDNPKKFAEDFNDTVDQEGLEYTPKIIFARLGKYARNWIENQSKYSKTPTPDSYESGRHKRV